MINWKELEKFILPGKVVTLVIMVDGKEIGAFSFNVDSLAYKEILESKAPEPVKIAEKDPEKKEAKPAAPAATTTTTKKRSTKKKPEPAQPAANVEDNEDNDGEDNDDLPFGDDDKDAQTVKDHDALTNEKPAETFVEKAEKEQAKEIVQQQADVVMAGSPTRITRDQVMMGGQKVEEFPKPAATQPAPDLFAQGTTPAPEKPAQQTPPKISDEW